MGRCRAPGRLVVLSSLVIALVLQPATAWSQTPPPFAPFPPETPAAASAAGAGQSNGVGGANIGGGSRMTDDAFTPVLQSVPSSPRWFKGADDRVHLVYELLLTN